VVGAAIRATANILSPPRNDNPTIAAPEIGCRKVLFWAGFPGPGRDGGEKGGDKNLFENAAAIFPLPEKNAEAIAIATLRNGMMAARNQAMQ